MNKNYYCSADRADCRGVVTITNSLCPQCPSQRRKWETPKQFKQRTGRGYPKNMAVYVLHENGSVFYITDYKNAKMNWREYRIICANTDFGPPPADWVPSNESKADKMKHLYEKAGENWDALDDTFGYRVSKGEN